MFSVLLTRRSLLQFHQAMLINHWIPKQARSPPPPAPPIPPPMPIKEDKEQVLRGSVDEHPTHNIQYTAPLLCICMRA